MNWNNKNPFNSFKYEQDDENNSENEEGNDERSRINIFTSSVRRSVSNVDKIENQNMDNSHENNNGFKKSNKKRITEDDEVRFKFRSSSSSKNVVNDNEFEMKEELFPELVAHAPTMAPTSCELKPVLPNFAESLKKEIIVVEEPVDEDTSHLDVFTYNKRTKKMTFQPCLRTKDSCVQEDIEIKRERERDLEFVKLKETLTSRHDQWRRNYIRTWGMDEYSRTYHCTL